MLKKIFILSLLLSSSISFSQNDDEFEYVTSSTSGNLIYVHFEKDNYGTKEFWLKITEPSKSIKSKNGKIIKSGGGYTLEYCKMNCTDKDYSISDLVRYDKNGNPRKTEYYSDEIMKKLSPVQ